MVALRAVARAIVVLAVAFQLAPLPALALPGDLDTTFGTGGRLAIPMASTSLGDVAVQPDGKIVVVGISGFDGVVVRLLPDGTPDTDFGAGGSVVLPSSLATRVALDPGGDLVVAGVSVSPPLTVFVARLDASGALVPGFGAGGIVNTPVWAFATPETSEQAEPGICDVAVAPGGGVVLGLSVGIETTTLFGNFMGAVRYGADGAVDLAFGGSVAFPAFGVLPTVPAGIGVIPSAAGIAFCSSMALDGAGGVLLGGQQILPDVPLIFEPLVGRLDAGGDLDPAFGSGGLAFVPGFTGPLTNSSVRAIVPDGLGRVVIAGPGFELARYDATGGIDATFGMGGVADLPGLYPSNALALDAGYLLTAGRRASGSPTPVDLPFALMRALSDGSLDPGFAGGDVASTSFAGWPLTSATALAVDGDGRAVVAGTLAATAGGRDGLALARFLGGEGPPTTTTTTTTTTSSTTTTTSTTPPPPGTPLTGERLTLTATGDPQRRRLAVVSRDPAIGTAITSGGADDPRIAGAALRIRSAAGAPFDVTHPLPAAGWSAAVKRGAVVGWRYRSDAGPIRRVVVQNGRRLKIVGAGSGLPWTLAQDPDPVALDLTLGGQHHCLAFGGETRFRPERLFGARRAPAPATCP